MPFRSPVVRRRRAGAVLGLLLLLPPAVSARSAREEAPRECSRTVPMRAAQAFHLEHQQGDGTISTHTLAEARIVAHIRVSAPTAAEAQAALQQVAIDVQETPAAIAVRTRYPDTRSRNVSYSVDYELTLPETAPLLARNSFGDMSVRGLKAEGDVRNSHGRLTVTDGRGRQRLENAFGAVEVARIDGDVSVTNQNGAVRVTEVQGALDVTNRFASVEARLVRKAATIVNSNGGVLLADAGGPSRITNSFGTVEASLIRGDLTGANGEVAVLNVGPAYVKTSFGLVRATGVTGALDVENSNGAVNAAEVKGPVTVKTSFAAVVLSRVEGPSIDVRNQNGAVEVESAGGAACTRVTLVTSFAPIRVRLAESGGYDVTARTSFGSIRSDLPITATGSLGTDSLSGRIGAGGCALSLTDSNGNIEILKATAAARR